MPVTVDVMSEGGSVLATLCKGCNRPVKTMCKFCRLMFRNTKLHQTRDKSCREKYLEERNG